MLEDKAALSKSLAQFVVELSAEAIADHGKFSVAFSGGSLAKILGSSLLDIDGIEWGKWHVFFADERCVPLDHEDSNYRLVNDNFLSKVRMIMLSTMLPTTLYLVDMCSIIEGAVVLSPSRNQDTSAVTALMNHTDLHP